MNQARIKLIPLLIHAFCVVQTFRLYKFMAAMPGAAKRDSTDSKGLTEYVLTILLGDHRLESLSLVRVKKNQQELNKNMIKIVVFKDCLRRAAICSSMSYKPQLYIKYINGNGGE